MLRMLSVLASRSSFDNSNYNYDNSNTNLSSHLYFNISIDPAHMAKNDLNLRSVGTSREGDPLKAKA
jgi:hypothetical protein